MIGTRPVVTVCPAGRKEYLAVLARHLLRLQGFVDRHDFWLNTAVPEDVAFLEELERKHPAFFRIVRVPPPTTLTPHGRTKLGTTYHIGAFFPHASEPGTVYVRFDDDICYIHPGSVETLVQYRISHPEPFLVYPTIVNNSLMSALLQAHGALPRMPGCPYSLFGRGWSDTRFAAELHRRFIDAVKRGDISRWRLPNKTFSDYERVSINCIAWLGEDMAKASVSELEEQYLATERPAELGRPNALCGSAVVAHFAYGPQRQHLDRTGLLQEYARLA